MSHRHVGSGKEEFVGGEEYHTKNRITEKRFSAKQKGDQEAEKFSFFFMVGVFTLQGFSCLI